MLLRKFFTANIIVICCALTGCYLSPPTSDDPHDPFEHVNRDTNRFNTKLDDLLIRPTAEGYTKAIPYAVRSSVGNFFENLDEPEDIANDILQGNVRWALNDAWRFVLNTTVGVGGLVDVAQPIGLTRHDNNFGLTLNGWGIYSAYLVLPVAGPRTVGSALGILVDYHLGVTQYFVPLGYSVILSMLDGLNARAELLNTEQAAGGLVFDRYLFYRSAYLQRQTYLVNINKQGPYYVVDDSNDQATADH